MQDRFAMSTLKSCRLPKSTTDLALTPLAEFDSLNAALDHYTSHPWQALALPTKTAPFQD
jgi:hypothetical protein